MLDSIAELWDGPPELLSLFEEYLQRGGFDAQCLFFRQVRTYQRDVKDNEARRALGLEILGEFVEAGSRRCIAFPSSLLQELPFLAESEPLTTHFDPLVRYCLHQQDLLRGFLALPEYENQLLRERVCTAVESGDEARALAQVKYIGSEASLRGREVEILTKPNNVGSTIAYLAASRNQPKLLRVLGSVVNGALLHNNALTVPSAGISNSGSSGGLGTSGGLSSHSTGSHAIAATVTLPNNNTSNTNSHNLASSPSTAMQGSSPCAQMLGSDLSASPNLSTSSSLPPSSAQPASSSSAVSTNSSPSLAAQQQENPRAWLDVVMPFGRTALHAASFLGHAPCVAILLVLGANDKIRDYIKLTAKEQAKGEAIDVFSVFEKKGVKGLQKKYPKLLESKLDKSEGKSSPSKDREREKEKAERENLRVVILAQSNQSGSANASAGGGSGSTSANLPASGISANKTRKLEKKLAEHYSQNRVEQMAESIERRMKLAQERPDYQPSALESEFTTLLKMILTGKAPEVVGQEWNDASWLHASTANPSTTTVAEAQPDGEANLSSPSSASPHQPIPIQPWNNSPSNQQGASPTISPRDRVQAGGTPTITTPHSTTSNSFATGSSNVGAHFLANLSNSSGTPTNLSNTPTRESSHATMSNSQQCIFNSNNTHNNSNSSNLSNSAWRSVARPSQRPVTGPAIMTGSSPRVEKDAVNQKSSSKDRSKNSSEFLSNDISRDRESASSTTSNLSFSPPTFFGVKDAFNAETQQHYLEHKVERLTRRWSDKRGRDRVEKSEKSSTVAESTSSQQQRAEKTVEWEKDTEIPKRHREREREAEREKPSDNVERDSSRDGLRRSGNEVELPVQLMKAGSRDSPRTGDRSHVIRTSPQSSGEIPLPSPTSNNNNNANVGPSGSSLNIASSLATSLANLLPAALQQRGGSTSPSPPNSKQSSGDKLIRLSGGPLNSEHRKRSNSERAIRGSSGEKLRMVAARAGDSATGGERGDRPSPQHSGDFLVSFASRSPSNSISSEPSLIYSMRRPSGGEVLMERHFVNNNNATNSSMSLSGSLSPSTSPIATSPMRTRAGSGGVNLVANSGPLRNRSGSRGSTGRLIGPAVTGFGAHWSGNNVTSSAPTSIPGNSGHSSSPSKGAQLDPLRSSSGSLVPLPSLGDSQSGSPNVRSSSPSQQPEVHFRSRSRPVNEAEKPPLGSLKTNAWNPMFATYQPQSNSKDLVASDQSPGKPDIARPSVRHHRSSQHRSSWHCGQSIQPNNASSTTTQRRLVLREDGGGYAIEAFSVQSSSPGNQRDGTASAPNGLVASTPTKLIAQQPRVVSVILERQLKSSDSEFSRGEREANEAEFARAGDQQIDFVDAEERFFEKFAPLGIELMTSSDPSDQSLSPKTNRSPQSPKRHGGISPNTSPEIPESGLMSNSPSNLSPSAMQALLLSSDPQSNSPQQYSPMQDRLGADHRPLRIVKREHVRDLGCLLRDAMDREDDGGVGGANEEGVSEVDSALRHAADESGTAAVATSSLLNFATNPNNHVGNHPGVWTMDRPMSIALDSNLLVRDEHGITYSKEKDNHIVLASPRASTMIATPPLNQQQPEKPPKRVEKLEKSVVFELPTLPLSGSKSQHPPSPKDEGGTSAHRKSRSALNNHSPSPRARDRELMTSPRMPDRAHGSGGAEKQQQEKQQHQENATTSDSEDSVGAKPKSRSAPQFKWKRKPFAPRGDDKQMVRSDPIISESRVLDLNTHQLMVHRVEQARDNQQPADCESSETPPSAKRSDADPGRVRGKEERYRDRFDQLNSLALEGNLSRTAQQPQGGKGKLKASESTPMLREFEELRRVRRERLVRSSEDIPLAEQSEGGGESVDGHASLVPAPVSLSLGLALGLTSSRPDPFDQYLQTLDGFSRSDEWSRVGLNSFKSSESEVMMLHEMPDEERDHLLAVAIAMAGSGGGGDVEREKEDARDRNRTSNLEVLASPSAEIGITTTNTVVLNPTRDATSYSNAVRHDMLNTSPNPRSSNSNSDFNIATPSHHHSNQMRPLELTTNAFSHSRADFLNSQPPLARSRRKSPQRPPPRDKLANNSKQAVSFDLGGASSSSATTSVVGLHSQSQSSLAKNSSSRDRSGRAKGGDGASGSERLWSSLESLGRKQVVSRAAGERAAGQHQRGASDDLSSGIQTSPRSTSMSGVASNHHQIAREAALQRASRNLGQSPLAGGEELERAPLQQQILAPRLSSFTDLFGDSTGMATTAATSTNTNASTTNITEQTQAATVSNKSEESETSDGRPRLSSRSSGLLLRFEFDDLPAVLSVPEENSRFIQSLLPDFDAQFQDMLCGVPVSHGPSPPPSRERSMRRGRSSLMGPLQNRALGRQTEKNNSNAGHEKPVDKGSAKSDKDWKRKSH